MFAQGGDERGGRRLSGAGEGDFGNRGDVGGAHGALGRDFVHAEPVGGRTAAGERDAAGFHFSLGAAVFTPTAVQDREDDVPGGVEPLGQGVGGEFDKPGAGQDFGYGLAGTQRDLTFGGKTAAEDDDLAGVAHRSSFHSRPSATISGWSSTP